MKAAPEVIANFLVECNAAAGAAEDCPTGVEYWRTAAAVRRGAAARTTRTADEAIGDMI